MTIKKVPTIKGIVFSLLVGISILNASSLAVGFGLLMLHYLLFFLMTDFFIIEKTIKIKKSINDDILNNKDYEVKSQWNK